MSSIAFTRQEILEGLAQQRSQGKPAIDSGAGTGISVKFAEAGGSDLLIINNSGRYRMPGRGSLAGLVAYGDANERACWVGLVVVMGTARGVGPGAGGALGSG